MNNSENKNPFVFVTVIGVILACLQPILWYGLWTMLADKPTATVPEPNNGLSFVCVVSAMAFALAIIWLSGYINKGENPWKEK